MKLKMLAFFVFFYAIQHALLATDPVTIRSIEDYLKRSPVAMEHVGVYIDSTRRLTEKEVLNKNMFRSFKKDEKFSQGAVYWFFIHLENTTNQDVELILFSNEWKNSFWEINDDIIRYKGERGALLAKVHDDFYSGQNNDGKLPISLAAMQESSVLVKVDGRIGELPFKIDNCFYLEQRQHFEERANRDLFAIGVFLGIVVVLMLINIVLSLAYSERSSFFYLLFVLLMSAFQAGYYKLIWWLFPSLNFDYSVLFPLIWFFYVWFVATYLDFINQHRMAWSVTQFLAVFTLLSFLVLVVLYHYSSMTYYMVLPRLNTVFAILSIPFMFYTATAPGKLKYFVLVGLFFGVSGAIVTTLSLHFHFLDSSYHYTLAGSGLEMVSFLVGLAYKMYSNKQAAEKATFMIKEKEKEKEHLMKIQQLQQKKHEAELQLKNNELISLSMRVASKNEVLDKVYQHVKENNQVKDKGLIEEIRTKLRLEDDWATFKIRFEKINPFFFKRLYEVSNQLTENDLRVASLIYINLDTHQICQLLNVSQRTVQTAKYRLKKKLGLAKETDLKTYLHQLSLDVEKLNS